MNTGHDVRLILDEPAQHHVNMSGGPLLYQYRISDVILHFGSEDSTGSEHSIDGKFFPAEVNIYYVYDCINTNIEVILY